MGLFDAFARWRSNSRIRALEAALQGRPTPALYLQLADAHKQAGNSLRSAQVLKLASVRFPSAPEITRRQAEAAKAERESEKRRLLEKITTHPNPILYARLAEVYKLDGDVPRTIDTCQRGIKAFPRYGGTYLVLGQIYIDNKKWPEAVAQLEKSVELDKYNYMALKLLAQVYLQLGQPAEAAKRLEDILYFAPGDEAILELLKKAREQNHQPQPEPVAAAVTRAEPRSSSARGTSVVRPPSLTRMPAASGRMAAASGRTPAASGRMAAPAVEATRDQGLSAALAGLRAVGGVTGALLVDQYGLVMAADLDSDIDEALAGALITNVYRTASSNAVKLDVGQFEEGLIEGVSGNIHIVQFDELILAVFARADVKIGLLEKSIREVAALVLQQK